MTRSSVHHSQVQDQVGRNPSRARRDNWSGLKTCCYVPRGLESGDFPKERPDIVHSDPFPPRPEAPVPA
jgi:hypothetical protein